MKYLNLEQTRKIKWVTVSKYVDENGEQIEGITKEELTKYKKIKTKKNGPNIIKGNVGYKEFTHVLRRKPEQGKLF